MLYSILYAVIAILVVPWYIKTFILDAIEKKLNDTVNHLSVIERDLDSVKDQLKRMYNMEERLEMSERHLVEIANSASNIELQLDSIHRWQQLYPIESK